MTSILLFLVAPVTGPPSDSTLVFSGIFIAKSMQQADIII